MEVFFLVFHLPIWSTPFCAGCLLRMPNPFVEVWGWPPDHKFSFDGGRRTLELGQKLTR